MRNGARTNDAKAKSATEERYAARETEERTHGDLRVGISDQKSRGKAKKN